MVQGEIMPAWRAGGEDACRFPIILLGVVHRDPRAGERLERVLAGLEFGAISVEVSPYALAFRRRQGPELLRRLEANLPLAAALAGLDPARARGHAGLAWLEAYLRPPGEWLAARREARRRGLPCLARDFSMISRRLLASAHLLVTVENLAALLSGPAPAGAGLERRRAADLLGGRGGWLVPAGPEPLREAGLARRLARLAALTAREGRGPLVHLGGWRHLLEGLTPPTLAQRLDLPPWRRILV